MLKLYSFHWDCGRQGEVDGLFAADSDLVDNMIGERVHFGEILGKHSEVYGKLDREDLEIVSEDKEKIDWLVEVIGSSTISGYNPLGYLRIKCEKCGYPICEDGGYIEHEFIDGSHYCNDKESLDEGETKTCAQKVKEEMEE